MGIRSKKKPPYIAACLYEKISKIRKNGDKAPIKVFSRGSTIITDCIGLNFLVHNGKDFNNVFVKDENMVGYKFGEFVQTRKFVKHGGDKKTALKKIGSKKK